jgi:ferritin
MNKNVEKELNVQINEEMYSAYLYLAIAAWFEEQSLDGCAHWMEKQATEEMSHAMKFYKYIIERGGHVGLETIEKPKFELKTVLDAFNAGLNHEEHVTARIHFLLELARKESDYPTESMLKWFVDEQVEEEANANKAIDQLKMIGDSQNGILMFDKMMGARK